VTEVKMRRERDRSVVLLFNLHHKVFFARQHPSGLPFSASEPVVKSATSDTEAMCLRRLFELNILLLLLLDQLTKGKRAISPPTSFVNAHIVS